jgi:hypothetical protein
MVGYVYFGLNHRLQWYVTDRYIGMDQNDGFYDVLFSSTMGLASKFHIEPTLTHCRRKERPRPSQTTGAPNASVTEALRGRPKGLRQR